MIDLWAAIAAVLIFLIGQFILKLMLEPIVIARGTLAKARITFDFFANVWANPPMSPSGSSEGRREAQNALRLTAGELRVIPASVLGYRLVRRAFGLPSPDALKWASTSFICLSNGLMGGTEYSLRHVQQYSDEVKAFLKWR